MRSSGAHQRWMLPGADIFDIQHLLGHASIQTTNLYLTGMSGVSDQASQKLAARLPFLTTAAPSPASSEVQYASR